MDVFTVNHRTIATNERTIGYQHQRIVQLAANLYVLMIAPDQDETYVLIAATYPTYEKARLAADALLDR